MRVRMTETTEGSRDGINAETFEEGNVYEVPASLGETFVKTGRAVEADKSPHDPSDEPSTAEEEETSGEETSDEEPEEVEVTKERTSDGSPWYQFRVDGELITEVDDGEESPITVLGEQNAETKREELEESLNDEADAD